MSRRREGESDGHAAEAAGAAGLADAGPLRCACGSLLARRVADGVELKCRRCKRVVHIALGEEGWIAVS